MFRLAVFLGIVLFLYHTGTKELVPDAVASTGTTAKPPVSMAATRIAARATSTTVPLIAPDDSALGAPPEPFDISQQTAAAATLPADTRPTAEAETGERRWKVASPQLTLRSGPSLIYPKIAILKNGETVVSEGLESGEWLWVRSSATDKRGYVPARLVLPLR